jgi:hypothetical protein
MLNFPLATALQLVPAGRLIRAMSQASARSTWSADKFARQLPPDIKENFRTPGLMQTLHESEDAVDKAGSVGLTVSFKEIIAHDDHDTDIWPFTETGEFYVVTSLLDGSGRQPEFKTKVFEGIDDGDRLPLGDGGMLVGMLQNPRWFVDMHMLIMESDGDVRAVGQAIEDARKASGLTKLLPMIGSLAAFDPSAVTKVVAGVDAFLGILAGLLRENGDDHVATIHDFYLKSQAFGAGRHPKAGTRRFQDVDAAYEIALTPLEE